MMRWQERWDIAETGRNFFEYKDKISYKCRQDNNCSGCEEACKRKCNDEIAGEMGYSRNGQEFL